MIISSLFTSQTLQIIASLQIIGGGLNPPPHVYGPVDSPNIIFDSPNIFLPWRGDTEGEQLLSDEARDEKLPCLSFTFTCGISRSETIHPEVYIATSGVTFPHPQVWKGHFLPPIQEWSDKKVDN